MGVRQKRPARKARPGRKLGTRKVPRGQRMEEMLQVAARVFASRGYHAASMDEIAEIADISKPLLYRYYGSKDGLYLALVERAGRHLMEGIELIRGEPDPVKRLDLATVGLLSFVDRYRDFWQVLYNEAMGSDSPVARKVQDFRAQMIASSCVTISELLDDPTPEGRREAEPLAHALLGGGEAMARWWLQHPEVPVERMRELILDYSLPAFRTLRDKRKRQLARRKAQ